MAGRWPKYKLRDEFVWLKQLGLALAALLSKADPATAINKYPVSGIQGVVNNCPALEELALAARIIRTADFFLDPVADASLHIRIDTPQHAKPPFRADGRPGGGFVTPVFRIAGPLVRKSISGATAVGGRVGHYRGPDQVGVTPVKPDHIAPFEFLTGTQSVCLTPVDRITKYPLPSVKGCPDVSKTTVGS